MEDWVSKCGRARIMVGNCLRRLADLPDGSVHCCVTSPPYFGLRDYGHEEQLGSERRVEDYVENLVEVFCEVRRVLRDDGTAWLNLGDSYAGSCMTGGNKSLNAQGGTDGFKQARQFKANKSLSGVKPKDLVGVPWRVAFALQADGWYLRQDIIWSKPNPMPESVTDRCTKSHEYIFLLSKSARYYYDNEAVKEGFSDARNGNPGGYKWQYSEGSGRNDSGLNASGGLWNADNTATGRNRRSVWTVATQSYKGAHFATYPPKLIEPCIKAGTSEEGCCSECGAPWVRLVERMQRKRQRPNEYTKRTGEDGTGNSCANTVDGVDVKTIGWQPSCQCVGARVVPCTVLDPFNGSGTTGDVSVRLGRQYVGCELNPDYVELAKRRIGTALRESARPLLDSR